MGAAGDIAGIPSKTMRLGEDEKLQMVLIGNLEREIAPKNGFRLIIIMPGGNGSAEFKPFVKRIYKDSLVPKKDLVYQLNAPN